MVMNVADALAAYRQGGSASSPASTATPSITGGDSFADTLKKFGTDTLGALKEGEQAAAAGATGKAGLASVVTAINSAEMMLQTVVTIRDKVIAAYQDITKTAI